MAIKNWTVTVETVKSAAAREVYFENKDEPSHANSLSLTRIWRGQNTTMEIIKLCEQAKAKQRAKRKGGRPPTPAVEFVFVLPSDLDENGTDDDWKLVIKDIVISLARSLDVDPEALNQVCRGSLHREPKTSYEDSTKGNHVHLMVGKILPDGTPIPKIQKKKALFDAKQAFNAAVLEHLGHSHDMYVARTKSNKKKFKNSWFKNNAELSRAVQAIQRCCTNLTKYTVELNAIRIKSTQNRLDKALRELEELERAKPLEEEQSIWAIALKEQAEQVKAQSALALDVHKKIDEAEGKLKKKMKPKRDKNGTIIGWIEADE